MARGWTRSITALTTLASASAENQISGSLSKHAETFPRPLPTTAWSSAIRFQIMQAGQRLGMKTIFIEGEPDRQKAGAVAAAESADAVAGSLLQAVALLV